MTVCTDQRGSPARTGNRLPVEPLAVLAGGILGSAARASIGAIVSSADETFPTETLIVNVVGSLLLGLYLARRQRAVAARWSLELWAIGALGAFTTFSAFSIEVVQLFEAGRAGTAIGYVLASTLGALAAALFGDRLGRTVR